MNFMSFIFSLFFIIVCCHAPRHLRLPILNMQFSSGQNYRETFSLSHNFPRHVRVGKFQLSRVVTFFSVKNFSALHTHVPRVIYYFDMTSSLCAAAPTTTFAYFTFPSLSLTLDSPTLFSIFPPLMPLPWTTESWCGGGGSSSSLARKSVQRKRARARREWSEWNSSSTYMNMNMNSQMRDGEREDAWRWWQKASNVSKNILLWKRILWMEAGVERESEREWNPTPLLHKYQLSRHAWHRGWWDLIYDSWNSKSKNGIKFFFPSRSRFSRYFFLCVAPYVVYERERVVSEWRRKQSFARRVESSEMLICCVWRQHSRGAQVSKPRGGDEDISLHFTSLSLSSSLELDSGGRPEAENLRRVSLLLLSSYHFAVYGKAGGDSAWCCVGSREGIIISSPYSVCAQVKMKTSR